MQETPRYRETFARLLGFLRPYKVSLIVSIFLAVGSQVAALGLIWVTKHVIDDALAPHDTQKLCPGSFSEPQRGQAWLSPMDRPSPFAPQVWAVAWRAGRAGSVAAPGRCAP